MFSELREALEKDPSEGFPLVRKLLDAGAAVNERISDELSRTPLHQAAKSKDCEKIKLLLDKGADISALNVCYKMLPLVIMMNPRLDHCSPCIQSVIHSWHARL